jgi:hypothetical protein
MGARIAKLWVNGLLVEPERARLEAGTGGSGWRVVAVLAGYNPFRRRYGLSLLLDDGRTVHGTAALVGGDLDEVVFEGVEPLEGSWSPVA